MNVKTTQKYLISGIMSVLISHAPHSMDSVELTTNEAPPPQPTLYTDCEHNQSNLVIFGSPTVFLEFSSERLTYRLPKDTTQQAIIDLCMKPEVSKTLFRDEEQSSIATILEPFFKMNLSLQNRAEPEFSTKNPLPWGMMWEVAETSTNQFIGMLVIHCVTSDHMKHSAPSGDLYDFYVDDQSKNLYMNISYAIEPCHHNQGYATEMSLTLIQKLFQYTNADVILHGCHPENLGSAKSATKCGFTFKGIGSGEEFRLLRKTSQEYNSIIPPH